MPPAPRLARPLIPPQHEQAPFPLTDWGLARITIPLDGTILDIGCGGGRTIQKLAAAAMKGKVCGIDHSEASVAASQKFNTAAAERSQVDIRHGSVSGLPWPDATFDRATAVDTHFFGPNLPSDVREVLRVLKPGGSLILIAEVYKGAGTAASTMAEKYSHVTGMTLLTADEHRALLGNAGFTEIHIFENHEKGWIAALGTKPS